jgi:REP element-mobilizing transposase RayT
MPFWLLTNTFYGNWLPGDVRGSVTRVLEHRLCDDPKLRRIEHDIPGTSVEPSMPMLNMLSQARLKGPPIVFDKEKAGVLFAQFSETADYRCRPLHAVAIMWNHFHMVVNAPDDPPPKRLLADFKAYGSRALNRHFGTPASEEWWTENGSKRNLPSEPAVIAGVRYVVGQPDPLLLRTCEKGRIV